MSDARVQVYEDRLHEYLKIVMNQSWEVYEAGWRVRIATRTVDEWASDISGITLLETKQMLGGDAAPTAQERLSLLPEVNGETRPGVYTSCIFTPGDFSHTWAYVGSATAVVSRHPGLAGRVAQHQSEGYRESWKKKRNSYHYNVLDQEDKNRVEEFRVLAVGNFASGEPTDVNHMRATCLLAEMLYTAWLGVFQDSVFKNRPWLRSLVPWNSDVRPTNSKLTIQEVMKESDHATLLDPEEKEIVRNARRRSNMRQETNEERIHRLAKQRWYNRVAGTPAARMKRQKTHSKEEIAAFVAQENSKWPEVREQEVAQYREDYSQKLAGGRRAVEDGPGDTVPEPPRKKSKTKAE
ncbi:hypothetical protein K431DRAFT_310081 [Polychaeton citri CBS 116435]|uniref:Uncharacterized protein n=1 Tax=Polychaeton citri CBS 116435 TaxID=1314669 RepID=A0A9P4QGM0_9PEZI|nr:hypothetical protein K431DRAFT_310081 [Polychaeton citri CBS 116435]